MTPAMLILSPLVSAHPDAIAVAATVSARVLPEAWARPPHVANVKAVHAPEAGQGGKFRNQTCQVKYAHVTAGQTPGVMDQNLRWSKAWLANCRSLVGVMAGLLLLAYRRRSVDAVVARASC